MPRLVLLLLLLLYGIGSCKDVQPEEKPAVITGRDYTFCGYCGGWFVNVDSVNYRADIPDAYARENNRVWIRFEPDQRPGYSTFHWITIKSIRQR